MIRRNYGGDKSKMKIALLSNVNMNFVIRMLQNQSREQSTAVAENGEEGLRELSIYNAPGYGNELGLLLDPTSSYQEFGPDITFLVMDVMELLEHDLTVEESRVERWFSMLKGALKPEKMYYISDAWVQGEELSVCFDVERKQKLEEIWDGQLTKLMAECSNVRCFPYHKLIGRLGEERAFSMKMWYLGKILHTNEAQKAMAEEIVHLSEVAARTPKKVLLLDLDNTLWGGLAGENDHTPIKLSEDHEGLAYKNLQRVIAQMQRQGVILGIVSKNNEEDAMELIKNHPHMVLRPEAFAAKRINWQPKPENIREIAKELNLGLDSFVFWDDNPAERQLVKAVLPQVMVPDFPEKPEELAKAMAGVYRRYFEKETVTAEDLEKTKQYAQNAMRKDLEARAVDFESYLKQLDMELICEDPLKNLERLVQLINKTNQFNLTTRRYDRQTLQGFLEDGRHRVFLYRVKDCFGDNGIVSAVIIRLPENFAPIIDTFVMSCRVMGRNLEYDILADVEEQLYKEGYKSLIGEYLPTKKNKPVENLYETLGYEKLPEEKNENEEVSKPGKEQTGYCYRIELPVERPHYARLKREV